MKDVGSPPAEACLILILSSESWRKIVGKFRQVLMPSKIFHLLSRNSLDLLDQHVEKVFRHPDTWVLRHPARLAKFSVNSFYSVPESHGQWYTLLVVERDTPWTSILLVAEMDTPFTSILLAVKSDTPCMFIQLVLVVVKGIPAARLYCRKWKVIRPAHP